MDSPSSRTSCSASSTGAFTQMALAARAAYLAGIEDVPGAENRFLHRLVTENARTAFAREHGFDEVRTVEDFFARVPIRDYDGLSPWIERSASGEPHVLTQETPFVFTRTSGTSGTPKKIPWTRTHLLEHWGRFVNAGWGALIHRHPEMASRPDATLDISRTPKPDHAPTRARTTGNVPWMSASQRDWWRMLGPDALVPPGGGAPWSVLEGDLGADEVLYARVRLALESDLRAILSINPSSLLALAKLLDVRAGDLARELRDGTVLGERVRAPALERASEIEHLARRGRVRPVDVWPRLTVLRCWTAASAGLYLPRLREAFGHHVRIAPYSLSASEGPMVLCLGDHPSAGIPGVLSAFLEFVPSDVEPSRAVTSLRSWELRVNGEYRMIMTQANGLFRYDIGDVFRVVGTFGRLPLIEFVGRSGVVSSFTGEKLTEYQVANALRAAHEPYAAHIAHFTCCPVWADPPHYMILIEVKQTREAMGPGALEGIARAFDEELSRLNDEYPGKRATGRLDPPRARIVPHGTFERYRELLIRRGTPLAQVKDRLLHTSTESVAELLDLTGAPDRALASGEAP